MDKLLTISIAAYNMEKYIEETLSSCVIEKKYMDEMEVLIVNDGSTDSTVDIAQRYVEKYPNTFRIINKENGGYGTTVNTAIREARGKYFKLLDGDDWNNKRALSKFVEILGNEESDLIITDYVEKHETGRITKKRIDCVYGKKYPLKNQMFVLPMYAVCYKTSVLKANDIKLEKRILYTDSEFTVYPLFYVKTMSHYALFLYEYRLGRSGQSVGIKNYCRHIQDMYKVVDNMIAYYKNHVINNGAELMILYNISNYYRVNLSVFLWSKISKKKKKEMIKREEEIRKENPMVFLMAVRNNIKLILLRKSNYRLYEVTALYSQVMNWVNKIKR